MAEAKTRPTGKKVTDFLDTIEHEGKRKDGYKLLEIMSKVTGEEATMWGPSIIGFGTYTMTYANGKQADWLRIGFSPRKSSISLYIMSGFDYVEKELEDLGKYKTGKGCLYINKLADVDEKKLEKTIRKIHHQI